MKTYRTGDKEVKTRNERLDALSEFIDFHEVYVEDLMAIILAHLSQYRETEFKTSMLVNKTKFKITITKENKYGNNKTTTKDGV